MLSFYIGAVVNLSMRTHISNDAPIPLSLFSVGNKYLIWTLVMSLCMLWHGFKSNNAW